MVLHFAYLDLLYVFIPLFLLLLLYRWKGYKSPLYNFPLTGQLAQHGLKASAHYKTILWLLRCGSLVGLMILTLRPQWMDQNSKINVDGIDIMLALDVSGSMQCFDDVKDRRTRIDVAKTEAIRFIEKRIDDPMGVVIFGKEALSLCPLTLDKVMLKEMVGKVELGIISPDGTWLGTGLATAINRLKNSKAKSRIIILLTDGQPTPPENVEPDLAIELAKQFGIKIYTIGVGNANGGYIAHPFQGVVRVQDSINPQLLEKIARQTGGQYFRANNPKEMRLVYDKIDTLEKTPHQTMMFHHYYEAFLTFIWFVLGILGLELVCKLFIWRGV